MEVYMSLLEFVMRCYNTNNFENLSAILSPDCKYSSHWVFDVMVGNDEIENYLIQKSHAIESAKAFVVAKKGIITSPNNGECIVLFQKDCVENDPSCLLILKERNGKICGIHITDPGLFQFSIVE